LAENWVDYQESNPLNRQSFFGNAGIEITDKLNAFAQGDFSSSSGTSLGRVSGLIGGWGGTVPHGNGLYAPSLLADGLTTNPDYLPGGRFGLNCGPTGGCSKSQVWPKSPEMQRLLDSRPNPEAPVTMGMASTWAGVVRNNVDVRTYQIVLGLDGKLPGRGWTWEAYVSTGSSITTNESLGVSSVERWRYLINQPNYGTGLYQRGNEPGNGFGAGSMTCTSGFTALGQGERYYLESTGYQSTLPSADCQLAIGADMAATSNMEQTVYEANLQGSLLQLPAGDLGFAAGVSYRKNDYRYLPPVLQAPESIFDLPSGMYPRSQTRGKISTAEIYGELLVPVIAGVSGIEHLDLELGYRYSDNNPTQAVSSWKSLADWKINDAVRFRGGYQVANRAPNIAELFQSPDLFLYVRSKGDWCSDLNPANAAAPNPKLNPNAAQARALCEALMGPQGAATYYNNPDRPATSNQNYFSYIKGNPTLKEETAKTITLGIVADLTRDLSLSVDWWNIKIDNMISTEDPDNIYALCMSPENNPAFDPSTVACSKINRAVDTGAEGNTLLLYTNQGAIDFAGYDIALNWKKELGPGLLNFNTNLTLTDKALTQTAPEMPFNDWKGTSGPADLIGLNGYAYDWRSAVNATYTIEQWSASLRWRHLPSIKSLATGTPGNTDVPTNAYDLLDFSGRYNLSKTISLRFGIDNLLDRAPERVFPNATNTATGQTNRNFYDILGRRYYLGVNLHF
jgi:outer membrane receptor protein involved in Fe transport